jgi:hypothetical protein
MIYWVTRIGTIGIIFVYAYPWMLILGLWFEFLWVDKSESFCWSGAGFSESLGIIVLHTTVGKEGNVAILCTLSKSAVQ